MDYKEIVKKKFPNAVIIELSDPSVYTTIRWNTDGGIVPTKEELDAAIAVEVELQNKAIELESLINTAATVAFSGNYSDLSNKPTLSAVATSGSYIDLSNTPTLATVAISGSYNDLTDKPGSLASTAYVDAAIDAIKANVPAEFDTLKEVADKLANDDNILNALSAATNTDIVISGDASGSGLRNITLTLANSGVTPGTYNNSATAVQPFAVDSKGRVTGFTTPVTITPDWTSVQNKPAIVVKQELTTTVPAMTATSTKTLSNTAPTVADGTQIWSQAITPTEATSRINITGSFVVSHGTASRQISLALFRNDVCIATTLNFLATANKGYVLGFNWIDLPGSTAEATYSLRMWADGSGTWYTGRLATPYYAGTLASNYISVIELV